MLRGKAITETISQFHFCIILTSQENRFIEHFPRYCKKRFGKEFELLNLLCTIEVYGGGGVPQHHL